MTGALLWLAGTMAALAASAPDFSLSLQAMGENVEVAATAPSDHHFNTKAPMKLEDSAAKKPLRPSKASNGRVTFMLRGLKARTVTATLYLCDDANTFCEKRIVSAEWRGGSGASAPTPRPEPATPSIPKGPDAHGFLVNDPDQALKSARENAKPLLIHFFGIWCPPCNMLDEEVYSSPGFRTAAAEFVKLKLDADDPVSWPLKARFRVGGYPTVILATSEADEITRIVGFRPEKEFSSVLRRALAGKKESFAILKLLADGGDKSAAEKVGLLYLERAEHGLAAEYLTRGLEGVSPGDSRREALHAARIGYAEARADAKGRLQALEASLIEFPKTPGTVDRRLTLAGLYKEAGNPDREREHLSAARTLAEELAGDPSKLVGQDFTPADLWSLAANAQTQLGDDAGAKKAYGKAADAYRVQLSKLKDSRFTRGYNLEFAYCLWKSGKRPAAEAIYRRLERKFPLEFTFYFNHGKMLLGDGETSKAKPLALKAYAYSYGDNRLRAAELLAQVYVKLGSPENALRVARETLEKTKLPEDPGNRTHRYVAKLRALEQRLAAWERSSAP